jgi:hypothetical protein
MRTWLRSVVDAILGRVPGKLAGLTLQPEWRWTRISATGASAWHRRMSPRGMMPTPRIMPPRPAPNLENWAKDYSGNGFNS